MRLLTLLARFWLARGLQADALVALDARYHLVRNGVHVASSHDQRKVQVLERGSRQNVIPLTFRPPVLVHAHVGKHKKREHVRLSPSHVWPAPSMLQLLPTLSSDRLRHLFYPHPSLRPHQLHQPVQPVSHSSGCCSISLLAAAVPLLAPALSYLPARLPHPPSQLSDPPPAPHAATHPPHPSCPPPRS
eukprot:750336-Hanusia_phi.AAC.1